MPEIITIGESMVMMVAEQSDPLQFVTSFTRKIAGAESNVAIGLARLGHQVGWISSVGDDPFGTYVRNTIRGEGIDTSLVTVLHNAPTGLLVKERNDSGDPKVYYYRAGSAAANHMSPAMLQESYFDNAKILHITGILPALSANTRETIFAAIAIAKRKGLLISFDPNVRLQLWKAADARKTLLEIAHLSDLILPGLTEAELLIGTSDWEEVAKLFHAQGNRYVIMKNGSEGAYYSAQDKSGSIAEGYEQGFKVAQVVDTVGAGDGFAVGVLSGILEGLSLQESVKRGNAIGSLAVMVRGDADGYPTRDQLDEYVTKCMTPKKHKRENV
jgi:2-dehydro-3-deoxygluconokinase